MATKGKRVKREGLRVAAADLGAALRKDVLATLKAAPRALEDLRQVRRAKRIPVRLDRLGDLRKSLSAEAKKLREESERRLTGRARELQGVIAQRQQRLEAFAKRKRIGVPAKKGRFVVAGRIADRETRRGLPNVTVKAFDLDRKRDDPLGHARTDAFGYYRIEYDESQFADRDKLPELYIQVVDTKKNVLFTSTKSFVQKAGAVENIDAEVDGSQLPESRSLGEVVNRTVDARLGAFTDRQRVITGRLTLGVKAPALSRLRTPRLVTRKRRAPAKVVPVAGARRPTPEPKKDAEIPPKRAEPKPKAAEPKAKKRAPKKKAKKPSAEEARPAKKAKAKTKKKAPTRKKKGTARKKKPPAD